MTAKRARRARPRRIGSNLAWLKTLANEVRTYTTYWDSQFRRDMGHEEFHDKRVLTAAEMKRILKMVEDDTTYTFAPCNCNMGFRVGYDVCLVEQQAPGVPYEITHIFRVSERQLPEGWGWARLEPHFTSNERLKLYKMERWVPNESHYQY